MENECYSNWSGSKGHFAFLLIAIFYEHLMMETYSID